MRRIAVTGAAGHLGRALVRRLCALPEVEAVVAIDRAAAPAEPGHAKLRRVRCDVRASELERHLAGCDALVHLAFIVERGSRDEAQVESINIDGSQNAFESAARAGIGQIVYASSIAAYGLLADNAGRVLGEDAPLRGGEEASARSFYYPRHKAQVERWLDGFEARQPAIAIARLRPSVFLAPDAKRAAARALRLPLFLRPRAAGDPRVPIHATHQDDVVQAFELALVKRARGAFNVAAADPLPLCEWARAMGRPELRLPRPCVALADAAWRLRLGGLDPLWRTVALAHPLVVSSAKIERELGWRPRHATTAAALRAAVGRPTARASAATRLFLGSAVWAGRLGLGASARERYESRAIQGCLDVVLTGARASEWHVAFEGGRASVRRGLAADARATTTLADDTFHALLAGALSFATAQMTGRVRFRGDGNFSFFLGALVQRFRELAAARGPAGLPRRAFARAVLARAGLPLGRSAREPSAHEGGR